MYKLHSLLMSMHRELFVEEAAVELLDHWGGGLFPLFSPHRVWVSRVGEVKSQDLPSLRRCFLRRQWYHLSVMGLGPPLVWRDRED